MARRRLKRAKKVKVKRWLTLFGLIFLLLLSGKILLTLRRSVWKRGRFTFVLASRPVLVFSLSPKEKSLTVVKIPQNTFVETTGGYGLYRVEAVYPLGELEGKGGSLLTSSVQEFLGVPVEGWMKTNSQFPIPNSQLNKKEILDLKKRTTSWGIFLRPKTVAQFLKENLKTNLSFWDLAKIWLNLKKISASKTVFIDLEKGGALTEFSLPDGQTGKKGDPTLLDNLLQEFFLEPEIRKEKISIEVLNGTDYPGLAKRAARIITNIGGKVVRVGDSKERPKECQIKGGEKALKSFTFFKIKKIFNCRVFKEEREDLSLTVGESYPQKLFSKG